jgi:isopenicillin-N epimerase
MQRREFLIGTGLTLGAAAACRTASTAGPAPAAPGPSSPPPAPAPADLSTWTGVKAEFGLAGELVHMAGFFLASHPRVVRDAIDAHRRGLDLDPFGYVEDNVARLERAVRDAAAGYLGASADDVAMTDSTTMGLGLVYGGLRLEPKQEILSTTHDHIVTTAACAQRAARTGNPFRRVALYDDPASARADAIVRRLVEAVRPETRVIAITWVHSGTGVKLPVRAIAEALVPINAGRAARDRAVLCVDGVHGFGLEDLSVEELGCDFFIAGCHKWLFGPRGTGLVWGRRDAWPVTAPTIPSMDPMWRPGPIDQLPAAAMMTPGGFHSFEHRWALAEAFGFHRALGKARVAARIHALNRHLKEELARIPRVKVMTPMSDELSAGISCFTVDGRTPQEVVERLRARRIIASVTPSFYAPAYARLSCGLVTVEDDLEAALTAVRASV